MKKNRLFLVIAAFFLVSVACNLTNQVSPGSQASNSTSSAATLAPQLSDTPDSSSMQATSTLFSSGSEDTPTAVAQDNSANPPITDACTLLNDDAKTYFLGDKNVKLNAEKLVTGQFTSYTCTRIGSEHDIVVRLTYDKLNLQAAVNKYKLLSGDPSYSQTSSNGVMVYTANRTLVSQQAETTCALIKGNTVVQVTSTNPATPYEKAGLTRIMQGIGSMLP